MRRSLGLLAVALWLATPADALVRYAEGARFIEGVQLLQDAQDENAFFYLPQFPRLATKEDGETLEFLCVKYVGSDAGKASGGLFHALVEFTLPDDLLASVKRKLDEEVPGAVLRGPVPLMQAVEDGEEGLGGFRIVSATLNDTGEGGFTRNVLSSGRAPLTPGSKAVVAAMLNEEGATLLWETLSAPTSDVSVSITGYYEAVVPAYNARVTAEMETLYEHYSKVGNKQGGYTKRELRDISDELVRNGDITVEVVDRSKALEIDTKTMAGILDVVTSKLTDLMFDAEAGWSKAPDKEISVGANQIKGRQKRGWFSKTFGGTEDTAYYTDNQYVLKERTDIQRNRFQVNLTQSTTIRVPVDSSGNLGGLYSSLKDDTRYFRIVNTADTAFERQKVNFQIDGAYLDSFQDTLNFVSVEMKKSYQSGQPDFTSSLVFTHEDVKNGRTMKEISFPRLGEEGASWRDYQYRVLWSVRDRPTVSVPTGDAWETASDPAVSLVPPFQKRLVEVDADRALFAERGIRSAVLEFATPIAGKPKLQRKATLRPDDAEATSSVAIYHDRGRPVGWRVTWYSREGKLESDAQPLTSEYLFLVPPETESAQGDAP